MNPPTRCLIVDDERLARLFLRDLLSAHPDFQIVAEAADPAEAVEAVRQHRPDVLFLDIQMSGGDGFQVLNALATDLPFVVFVTAYDRHALRAFEVNALDYLLKPVEPGRLTLALLRLRERMSLTACQENSANALPELHAEDRVLLSLGKSGCFAQVGDILHVTARGKHSVVQLVDGRKVTVRQTMADWATRLPTESFATLDRSCIVQRRRIQRVDFTAQDALVKYDAPGCQLTLGRTAAQRLRSLLAAP